MSQAPPYSVTEYSCESGGRNVARNSPMKKRPGAITLAVLAIATVLIASGHQQVGSETWTPSVFRIKERVASEQSPSLRGAIYAEREGCRLLTRQHLAAANAEFARGLPQGYRRSAVTSVLDPFTGRIVSVVNALDVAGLDPSINEPQIGRTTTYLRYRVSEDGGRTWLFDEPMVQSGEFTARHPFEGVWVGKNSIHLGDSGSIPIVTRSGRVLVPAQAAILGPDGELSSPGGGFTYTDALVLIGTWTKGSRLEWGASQRIRGNPARSTRGMIEPTLAEFPDGRILMVMRGSNGGKLDPNFELPSYRWYSVSSDEGESWTAPEPWAYEDGALFFSPSSMSALLRHSSGRYFWAGNITPQNCKGNLPRWPMVMGEVNPVSLRLNRNTVITVDTLMPEDREMGRLDLSHLTLLEDRGTHEITFFLPRYHNAYKSRDWVTCRIAVEKQPAGHQ
jgi:hypothetical protein